MDSGGHAADAARVLAFEDLHWADPTSLDLMRTLADRGAQALLLIIAMTRLGVPSALERPARHHSVISLSPLDRAQVARHGRQTRLTPCAGPERGHRGSERAHQAACRCSSRRSRACCWSATRRAAHRRFRRPCSNQLRRAARPARRKRAKSHRSARCRSAATSPTGSSTPSRGAEPWPPAGGARSSRRGPTSSSSKAPRPVGHAGFKHALIRDAAYDSLLKSRRQTLHRRAADALVAADAEPEAVAHHFTEAGLDDLAIEWWGKAGDQAFASLSLPGGDRPSRQGDRDGGQGRDGMAGAFDGGAAP